LSNVPTLIKAPALRGIPKRETEASRRSASACR
jgi:hypothetical protein